MSKHEELTEQQLEQVVGGLRTFRPKEGLAQGMKSYTPDQTDDAHGGVGQVDDDLNKGGVIEL